MVNGLPYLEVDGELCEGCILGKQHRENFSNRAWKDIKQLALVHLDLCDPMETLAFGKARYFLTFIDDYSRKTWVYFLQEKSKAFAHFVELKEMIEKQSSLKILTLRSDNGGEIENINPMNL
jgi:hypothetical protein